MIDFFTYPNSPKFIQLRRGHCVDNICCKATNIPGTKSKRLNRETLTERETGERDSTMANEKPLRKISEAFKELEAVVNSQTAEIEVAPFSSACSLVSPLFGCLGIAFKFAEIDYVAKVRNFNFPFGSRENQRNELESKSGTFPFEFDRFLDGNRSMIWRRRRSQSRP